MSNLSNRVVAMLAGMAWYCGLICIASAAPAELVQDRYPQDPERGCFAFEAEDYVLEGMSRDRSEWVVEEGEFRQAAQETDVEGTDVKPVGATQGGRFIRMKGKNASGVPGTNAYKGPMVGYRMRITTPGRYRLYLRWAGPDGNSDSVYAQVLDTRGHMPPGPEYFLYHGRSMNYYGGWVWDAGGLKERTSCAYAGRPDVAEWNITEPGIYIIRLAAREHDTAVDALVFQTTNLPPPDLTPGTGHSGDGPQV